MALFTWKDVYVVNVEEVDLQHKKLVSLLNDLHNAMIIGQGQVILGTILAELVEYTVYHFATEEKYFDEYGYPEAELHKKQHDVLVKQVAAIQEKYNSGEKVLTLDVMNFLRDWLHDHIVGSDKLFGPFLNSKGIN